MSNKTVAILSYVTIIGWIIAYVKSKDLNPKSDLAVYHLRQGLGLFIVSFIVNILMSVVVAIVPSLGFINFIGIIFLILLIIGIINAANEEKKPLPVIGHMFENAFGFIDK